VTSPYRVSGAVVVFGATTALAGADLEMVQGESVALVGPSGAGKSTLLACLGGLVRPTRGAVVIGGRDLSGLDAYELADYRLREVGSVMQNGELLPELTLEENVQLPLRLAGEKPRVARRRALDLLAELGVGEAAHRRPDDVSGGQAQRAAVARALVHSPRLVLADEPTGALDSANGRLVMQALLEGVAGRGATLVMVTHDHELAAMLDRVVEVRDGRTTAATDVVPADLA
jgi:putative ABC transport system ATP-binding protein